MRMDARKRYSATSPFAPSEGPLDGDGGFDGLMPRAVLSKAGYVEHVVVAGDRLDRLAQSYYGDPRLWWVIAQANVGDLGPADLIYGDRPTDNDDEMLKIGTRIQIPAKPEGPK